MTDPTPTDPTDTQPVDPAAPADPPTPPPTPDPPAPTDNPTLAPDSPGNVPEPPPEPTFLSDEVDGHTVNIRVDVDGSVLAVCQCGATGRDTSIVGAEQEIRTAHLLAKKVARS